LTGKKSKKCVKFLIKRENINKKHIVKDGENVQKRAARIESQRFLRKISVKVLKT